MTRPYAEVIGDPIAHSKSPLIHNFWLAKLGIDAEYRACHVRAKDLADYFARRRGDADWRGCNVTMPHKENVVSLVSELDSDAELVGALNTIAHSGDKLIGYNTDVAGIREAFSHISNRPLPENYVATLISVIGAGGAARAAGSAFYRDEVTFFNRDVAKAATLADEFSAGSEYGFACSLDDLPREPFVFDPQYPDVRENRGADQRYCHIIINATTMGMAGQPEVPLNLECYPDDTIVFDMVYAPLNTRLLCEARARGMRTIDGLAMLVGQAAVAFEKFFFVPAPRKHDAELRALLTT